MLSKTLGDRAEKVRNVFVSEFIASSLRDLRQRMERLKKESGFKGTWGCSTGFFLGGYLPRLSINYVAMSKDMEKKLPQLYYIKMKISYDLGFLAIGVAMAT